MKMNLIDVNKMGMGFMRFDNYDQSAIKAIIDYAYNLGINYYEACTFYLQNNCENIVAYCLKDKPRYSYFLCDKISILGTNFNNINLEDFFNTSLKKCNTDYFDVYLLQALDRNCISILEKYNIYEFFQKKKKEGYIKNLGFSFHDTHEYLEYYLNKYSWDCVQLQLNYFDWLLGDAKNLYFLTKKYNIPIIVMGPLKGGTLINKVQNDCEFSPAALAFNFLNTLDNVKIILSGGNTKEQVKENFDLINANNKITELQWNRCKENIRYYSQQNFINCTNCKYCLPYCPKHIPINEIFQTYNQSILTTTVDNNKNKYYNILKSEQSFFDCLHCKRCEYHCPQHLDIPKIFDTLCFTYRL